jgi:hypothetical protein
LSLSIYSILLKIISFVKLKMEKLSVDMLQKGLAVQKCHQSKCKKERDNSEKQKTKVLEERKKLLKMLIAKKITFEEFKQKSKEMRDNLLDSKETKELTTCALKNCLEESKDVLEALVKVVEYSCKVEKDKAKCAQLKDAQKLLKKKDLTVEDYISIMKTIS